METSKKARYFDYLPEYESDLETYLGLHEEPDDVLVGSLTNTIQLARRKRGSVAEYRGAVSFPPLLVLLRKM